MYRTDRNEQTILIKGTVYSPADIRKKEQDASDDFEKSLFGFLTDWFAPHPLLTVRTSGSTGAPKYLSVKKEHMVQSARITVSFLDLRAGDKALLCLPLDYIAGKMMVVRALVAGLDIYPVPPSGHPLAGIDNDFAFAAMIPMQVFNVLQVPEEKKSLCRIRKLIVGGGGIDPGLEKALRSLPGEIYSTYGMTETLSHIALRRLNGTEASGYYTPFDSVDISLSEEDTLVIDAPLVCDERIRTNDIARLLPGKQFEILGRKDNIINSGGIKIQIETVESMFRPIISATFAITSEPDAKFGEIMVLLIEAPADTERIAAEIKRLIPPYWQPKKILLTDKIPLTENGKPARKAIKEIIQTK